MYKNSKKNGNQKRKQNEPSDKNRQTIYPGNQFGNTARVNVPDYGDMSGELPEVEDEEDRASLGWRRHVMMRE